MKWYNRGKKGKTNAMTLYLQYFAIRKHPDQPQILKYRYHCKYLKSLSLHRRWAVNVLTIKCVP